MCRASVVAFLMISLAACAPARRRELALLERDPPLPPLPRFVPTPTPPPPPPCEEVVAAESARLDHLPSLPDEVHAELVAIEPLLLAGVAGSAGMTGAVEWLHRCAQLVTTPTGGLRGGCQLDGLLVDLLHRDAALANGHRARDGLRTCLRGGGRCEDCVRDIDIGALRDAAHTAQSVQSNALTPESLPFGTRESARVLLAWQRLDADVLAALDAVITDPTPPARTRAALLLGAMAAIRQGRVDDAVTRLRRLRVRGIDGEPSDAYRRLAAICRRMGRDPDVADTSPPRTVRRRRLR